MRFTASILLRVAAGVTLGLSMNMIASAATPRAKLADTVAQIEQSLDARVGVAVVDTGSGEAWTHRPDERFLMNSTAKVPICGAILAQADDGELALSETLPVHESDLLSYAPVTSEHVGDRMSLTQLCLAALDMSDNTASNLLLDRLGGPEVVTELFRNADDPVSRLDRREPEMNSFAKGDPRDTTTPIAMAETMRALLLGDVLTPASREQLAEWMSHGAVTQELLRSHAPDGWVIADKSGSGSQTRNIIALISPPNAAPWIVTIFISDAKADFATRNAALKEVSAAVMAMIRS
ncbi:class A beta-lactamase [Rhodovibrio salinarum]|uniref:Beta-lactamase n=1 Tax=Rhodovibrio salinarum TaxID=1087 RepID=A0A934UYS9_9PROT|nr:class A beta-lactamase [Rhodovibrio salinarum]MBK1695635.1 class A beta-lactamase [Rhodovibrio salinarum]